VTDRTEYRNWIIIYSLTPIPDRNFDYAFFHKDFDGAEDACDGRYGYAGSLEEAKAAIDEEEDST